MHDVNGLLERMCATKGAKEEAVGAQQLVAERADPQPVAHPPPQALSARLSAWKRELWKAAAEMYGCVWIHACSSCWY